MQMQAGMPVRVKLVVQSPAMAPMGNTIQPDPTPIYMGMAPNFETMLPRSIGGATILSGQYVMGKWLACVYTVGPFQIPGMGEIVRVD